MTVQKLSLALTLIACVACTGSPRLPDKSWAPDGACKFVGNRADRRYCATTATQILANPEIYDGRLVAVNGWIVVGQAKRAYLYLSREALDGADLLGALRLKSGPKLEQITTSFEGSASEPIVWRVAGRFHLNRGKPGEKASIVGIDWYLFGSLDEIDDI